MTEETQANPISLTVQDIAFLLQIVETCTQRGAFRAEELTSIGAVYDKVKSFITANTQQPADAEQTQGTEQ
jgi:hypothetical protein